MATLCGHFFCLDMISMKQTGNKIENLLFL